MPYSAWTEERRNLHTNPKVASAVTSWAGSSGTGGRLDISAAGIPGISFGYVRNGNTLPSGARSYTTLANLVIGETYTVSAWVFLAGVPANGSWLFRVTTTAAGTTGTILVNPITERGQWVRQSGTFVASAATMYLQLRRAGSTGLATDNETWGMTGVLIELGSDLHDYYDGDTPNPSDLASYVWEGAANASQTIYQTRSYTPAEPTIPVRDLTTEEVLYGDRITSYRWEVLEHVNGVDQLVGILDGVADGSITWTNNAAVKGGGKISVVDLSAALEGMLRVADLKLESVRLRPVCQIQGLPENPLGVYLVSAAGEEWEDTGRVWSMELLDKCTVPAQDSVDQSYSVAAGTRILRQVRTILASCNEYIAIDDSNTLATSTGMVWESGTDKLRIINDLLDVAGYNSLWVDGFGNFQVTPRILPADRSIQYEVLDLPRELRDGPKAIYTPSWTRDRDSFEVPNKVIAVQAAGGDDSAAITGTWTNEDPSSPYSYQSRGRWITHTLDSVDCPEGTAAEILAFLRKRAQTTLVQMSSVQAQVKLAHLPIPVRVGDVIQFANTRAGVDARHVITRLQLDTNPLGMAKSTLQEVVSL